MKILEGNSGGKLLDTGFGNDFWNLTPQEKAKIKCGRCLWASMWSCEVFRMKKAVRKTRFCPCFKGVNQMEKKSVDRAYSIPKQARYQLRYTRL